MNKVATFLFQPWRDLGRMAREDWAALRVTRSRVTNRVLDAVGRAAGFCMADCWQPRTKSYGPGFAHWRCGRLRSDHASGWHRTGHYKWLEGQPPIYDPAPGGLQVGAGMLPRWLAGRHRDVMPRRREREWQAMRFDLMTAARQATAKAVERAVARDAERLIRGLRSAVRPSDAWSWRRSDHDPDRHDVHVHGFRPGGVVDGGGPVVGELGIVPFTGRPDESTEEQA